MRSMARNPAARISNVRQKLAAVRRLAYEASDAGLLSPDLAAGIRAPSTYRDGIRVRQTRKFLINLFELRYKSEYYVKKQVGFRIFSRSAKGARLVAYLHICTPAEDVH